MKPALFRFLRFAPLPAATALLVAILGACGQTGPLYLPGEPAPKAGLSLRPDTRSPDQEQPEASKPAPPAAAVPPAPSSVAAPPSAPPPEPK